MDELNPFLLTLTINPEAQRYFNILRQKHFPSERNFLDAHLMLFHQLPPHNDNILIDIKNIAEKTQRMTMQVSAVAGIGRGVAFKVESVGLTNLHRDLQAQWQQYLIPQDKQRLWPHITVQNKVSPEEAKKLLTELSANFKPFEIAGIGLSLWEYCGGPWEFIQEWKFTG